MAELQWSFGTAVELSSCPCREKSFRRRAGAGRHRPHRAPRRRVNAVCVRDFERALAAARAADAALARGETAAAARHSDDGEGILQHCRPADDLGHSPAEGFCADRRTRCRLPRQGGGRRHPRQDQRAARARRLAELQRDLRHHQQSLGSRPHARRLFRRIVGGAGGRLRAAVARFRHRRLAAGAGVSLRHLCAQADLRARAGARPHAAAVSGRCRASATLP